MEIFGADYLETSVLVYWGTVLIFLLLETQVPARKSEGSLRRRWAGNWSLGILSIFLRRTLLGSLTGVSAAFWAREAGFGLFNIRLDSSDQLAIPYLLALLLSFLILDAARYAFHRILHETPLLWRIHRSHHSDTDATTTVRIHPFVDMLALPIGLTIVTLLGVPPEAVALSGFGQFIVGWFSHSNVRVPEAWDRVLRTVIVTPAYHLVHHSAEERQTNSNYGTLLTWWDLLFDSRAPAPRPGEDCGLLGLETFRQDRDQSPLGLLINPFLKIQK